jgi:hypothetical protein
MRWNDVSINAAGTEVYAATSSHERSARQIRRLVRTYRLGHNDAAAEQWHANLRTVLWAFTPTGCRTAGARQRQSSWRIFLMTISGEKARRASTTVCTTRAIRSSHGLPRIRECPKRPSDSLQNTSARRCCLATAVFDRTHGAPRSQRWNSPKSGRSPYDLPYSP